MSDSGADSGRSSAGEAEPNGGFVGAISTRLPLQLRFSDTDKLGHVNNAVYATYAELGRLEFLKQLGIESATLILARLTIDFRRQVRLGDECSIQSRVIALGNSSFRLAQTLLANGRPAAEFEAVMVWFDYQRQLPVRLPDDVRRVLVGVQGDLG